MRIIPAIDIIDGKCVRLTQGDYRQKKTYNENPLEVAKTFEGAGVQYLHLVDLDGAKSGKIVNRSVLEEIATKTGLRIDFGGGLKTSEDVRIAFESGADQITGGSVAAKNRNLFLKWLELYGSRKIILGADTLSGKIAVDAWQRTTEQEVEDYISDYRKEGIEYVICTDVARDGMLGGSNAELYTSILEKTDVKLIASGGISSIADVRQMKAIGCEGVIIGKAIYEQKITLKELEPFL